MQSVLNDKQFIVGFSVGIISSVLVAVWKRIVSCQKTVEEDVSTKNKKKIKKNTDFKMVIVVRKDSNITKRELAAQCVRACVESFKISQNMNPDYVQRWQNRGQMKVALKVNSEAELLSVKVEADKNNLVSHLVRDADPSKNNGLVLAIGPDSVDDINRITGHLKLL